MRFLLLNQTFHPDVMATGQYLTEVAQELVNRGHEVTVITSSRAYDNPETRFPAQETWRGVRIYRVASTGFGKGAKWRRAMDFASFIVLCTLRMTFLPRQDAVVALTSPPLISFLGALFSKFRGSRFFYWVMDFNPDEAIAAGWLRADSLPAKVLEWISRFSLKNATKIIALDRFMADRIVAKGISPEKVAVLPPWSHDDEVRFDSEGRERFRKAHGLDGKFVVMYSGNHSPCHPLDTLLQAAEQLQDDPHIAFCFVGGGSEWKKIARRAKGQETSGKAEAALDQKSEDRSQRSSVNDLRPGVLDQSSPRGLQNVLCLPYQPLNQLAGSLSAADLHVVVMGDPFVGLVHPCKIYNILGVGAPVLYVGPAPSHLSEILASLNGAHISASARHTEPAQVVHHIQRIRRESGVVRRQVPVDLCSGFSKPAILPKLISELEAH